MWPGLTRATRRLLFFALLAFLSTTTPQRVATLLRKVQRCRAWWLNASASATSAEAGVRAADSPSERHGCFSRVQSATQSQPCQAQEAQER